MKRGIGREERSGVGKSTVCDSPHCKAGVTETRRGQALGDPFSSFSRAHPHQGHREQHLKSPTDQRPGARLGEQKHCLSEGSRESQDKDLWPAAPQGPLIWLWSPENVSCLLAFLRQTRAAGLL